MGTFFVLLLLRPQWERTKEEEEENCKVLPRLKPKIQAFVVDADDVTEPRGGGLPCSASSIQIAQGTSKKRKEERPLSGGIFATHGKRPPVS